MNYFSLYSLLSFSSLALILFLLYREKTALESSPQNTFIQHSSSISESKFSSSLRKSFSELGFIIKNTLRINALESLFHSALRLGITEEQFKIWLAKVFLAYLALISLQFFKIAALTISLSLILIYTLLEMPLKIQHSQKSLRKSLPHFLSCLKILCIKNNHPLKSAFLSIIQGLPQEFLTTKKLLLKFIEEFEEIGMQKAIENFAWDKDFGEDFKNLLIGINLSSSKAELLKFSKKIENKSRSADEIKRNELIENIQLYLLVPVMLMLLISSYPLFLAIKFSLQGAFL